MGRLEKQLPNQLYMTTYSFHFGCLDQSGVSVKSLYGKVGYDPKNLPTVSIWSAHPDDTTSPTFYYSNWQKWLKKREVLRAQRLSPHGKS